MCVHPPVGAQVLDEKVKELKDNFAHLTAEAERLKQSLQRAEDVLGEDMLLVEHRVCPV